MATENGTEAAAVAMPQLDPSIFPNLIFWLVVALVAIFIILSRVALPRISSILAERKGTITNDLAAAEELKQKAVAAEHAYAEALAKARADAAKIVADTRAEIQKDLDAATARADAEIAARTVESEARIAEIRAGAVDAITTVAQDTAGALVVALGGTVDMAAVQAAVAQRMKG